MNTIIDKTYRIVIPLLIATFITGKLPVSVALLLLIIRILTSNKDTAGIYLLISGGILGGVIRYQYPFIPVYGLVLNVLGLYLLKDYFVSFLKNKASIFGMTAVLIYFLLAYYLSPNVGEYVASNKISGIMLNGLFMFYGYFALVNSSKINNESLAQFFLLTSIFYFVYDMNLLHIAPANFFDYEWFRLGHDRSMFDEDILSKSTGYHNVGMNALFAVAIYFAQIDLDLKKSSVYFICVLQLVLCAGARQAILGFFVLIFLRYIVFNKKNAAQGRLPIRMSSFLFGFILIYIFYNFIQSLGISYLTDTFENGDKGREMLRLAAMKLFFEYPIFGTGIGGFQHHTYMLYPHNFLVEILCECGLVGAIYLSTMIVLHFKTQRMNVLYLTKNKSFLFFILMAVCVRVLFSADLSYSIELFSAVFACSYNPNIIENEDEIYV